MAASRSRVAPNALIGIGLWLVYVVIILPIQKLSGVSYVDWGKDAGSLWYPGIVSFVVGAAVVVAITTWLGWLGPALREQHRSRAGWALIGPILVFLALLVALASVDWKLIGSDFLVAALALGVTVGFAEEFVCRGALLVGLRGTFHEVFVWIGTCVIFGLMHSINLFLGEPASDVLPQIISAGMMGSSLYVLRRVTGLLVFPMLLHGLFDFTLTVSDKGDGTGAALIGPVSLLANLISIVAALIIALRTDSTQAEDYSVTARKAARAAAVR